MTVSTNAQDIAECIKARHHQKSWSTICPVARAMARVAGCTTTTEDGEPAIEPVFVMGTYAVLNHWNNRKPIWLPDEAQQWIKAYDAGKPVEPFSFECTP